MASSKRGPACGIEFGSDQPVYPRCLIRDFSVGLGLHEESKTGKVKSLVIFVYSLLSFAHTSHLVSSLTRPDQEPEVLVSIPGPATYFRLSFR